jgi:hypothetical protein
MSVGGWIFMLGSLACVWGLTGWCLHRVLDTPTHPARDGSLGARQHPASSRSAGPRA